MPQTADVVVVGAGLAGLFAARTLQQAGYQSVVIEARDRVGGRVVSASIGENEVVELGGQWSAPRNHTLIALARHYGLDFFPTYTTGAQVIELARGIRRQRGALPPLRPLPLLDVGLARWRLDRWAKSLSPTAVGLADRAEEWDNTSVGAWIDRTVRTREGRSILRVAVSTIWGADPHGVNLLQALSYIRGAGNFDALTGTETGELATRMTGGSALLPQAIAAELGDQVVCGRAVTAIHDRGAEVEVEVGGDRIRARRVIVAVPPELAAEIQYTPELPSRRQRALNQLPMADIIKFAVAYDRPFWREDGLSGQALSVRGPVTATFDNSPPSGTPGVLIGFAPGEYARTLGALAEPERRSTVLETLARLFGPRAGRPELFLEKDWSADPWSRGCYFGLAAPGALTGSLRTLREPVGHIHWAGAETAYENYGGMDGALASGERAAGEVVTLLSATAPQSV